MAQWRQQNQWLARDKTCVAERCFLLPLKGDRPTMSEDTSDQQEQEDPEMTDLYESEVEEGILGTMRGEE